MATSESTVVNAQHLHPASPNAIRNYVRSAWNYKLTSAKTRGLSAPSWDKQPACLLHRRCDRASDPPHGGCPVRSRCELLQGSPRHVLYPTTNEYITQSCRAD